MRSLYFQQQNKGQKRGIEEEKENKKTTIEFQIADTVCIQ
jgi:hypothetical protein